MTQDAETDPLVAAIERSIATMPVTNHAEAEAIAWALANTPIAATVAEQLRRDWQVEPKPGTRAAEDEAMRRLVKDDGFETVYPGGVATRVPRGACRCPITQVGDFCPVHGG